jgi:hypothetical protein
MCDETFVTEVDWRRPIEEAFCGIRIDTITLRAAAPRVDRKGATLVPLVKMRTRVVDELMVERMNWVTLSRGRKQTVGMDAHWRPGLKSVS